MLNDDIKRLFVAEFFRLPLMMYGFDFMLRVVWDEKEKRHLYDEDLNINSRFYNSKWLKKKRAQSAIRLKDSIYKLLEKHTEENRITNFWCCAETEKTGLFPKIKISYFLTNEV